MKFRAGLEFNYYSAQLRRRLTEFLSPWAFDGSHDVSFGGRVIRSVVLDFIEELAWVDYLTDFRMYSTTPDGATTEVAEARAATPDAILVSAPDHDIHEVT